MEHSIAKLAPEFIAMAQTNAKKSRSSRVTGKNDNRRSARVSVEDKQPQVHDTAHIKARSSPKQKRDIDPPGEQAGSLLKKNQGASAKIAMFTKEFLQGVQDAILQQECNKSSGTDCSRCSATCSDCPEDHQSAQCRRPLFRCLDCFSAFPLCRECIVSEHGRHPFHHVQRWTGTHFEKHSLSKLGLRIHLGHNGQPCSSSIQPPTDFVIVHTNGVHHCSVVYCRCQPGQQHWKALQLANYQLFPATVTTPQTAFTFQVLDDFHRHLLASKTSAYDYFNALKRHTDAVCPDLVPDRYREFMLVMQFWRALALLRRAGQAHNIDLILKHRRLGSVAVWCPACPEIGFNIDESVVVWASDLKYGNFRLQMKKKNGDPDDRPLVEGHAYFVEEMEYREYLKKVEGDSEVSLCSNLKVVRQQDRAKFKDTEVSGVVAVQCRHLIYLPQGMVDLVKGEVYARTDYALAHALGMEGLRQQWVMVTYDVWCQYSINLGERFKTFGPEWAENVQRICGAIPKMHIHGHNSECQIKHSLVYERYSGMTYSEGIESAWSEQNHAAASTKEQNRGHRHDTLDDFNGYWNWTKVTQLSSALLNQYARYSNMLVRYQKSLKRISALYSSERIAAWQKIYDNEEKVKIFKKSKRAPTKDEVYASLVAKERSEFGEVGYLHRGLELEDRLHALLNGSDSEVEDDYETLHDDLCTWRSQQIALYPQLSPLPPIDEENLAATSLRLPSSLSPQIRADLNLVNASHTEMKLREGYAFNHLESLKLRIQEWNGERHSSENKKKKGKKHQIQVNARMNNLKIKQCAIMDSYNPDQLWGKDTNHHFRLGDSSRQDPWFWYAGKITDDTTESPETWKEEDDRVRWSREKAIADRLQEEVEILQEESRRMKVSFTKMKEVWEALATQEGLKPGYSEYAYCHAALYLTLSERCLRDWESILNKTSDAVDE
ncbi:hypothetical protein NP233_g2032 [Leucocoprinus birnbaumii]|uniref:CxC2-like cysteine cluster KDZ transposase-associated domain-containing protein n=1 Tax=Leucocoprinus birnbaumii TaxID=56174 RepID=A0AAD5W120_9AGAR|nr:hypothetical protein NP233_g2032 [Leucocoprinus birnbaumii]